MQARRLCDRLGYAAAQGYAGGGILIRIPGEPLTAHA
jgi:hypothetical protein